jgi:hypothetical protein
MVAESGFSKYLHQAIDWRSNFEPTCGWCDDDNETAATAVLEGTLWFVQKILEALFFKKLVVSIIDDGIHYSCQLEKFAPSLALPPSPLLIYDSLLIYPPLYPGSFLALQACSGSLERDASDEAVCRFTSL